MHKRHKLILGAIGLCVLVTAAGALGVVRGGQQSRGDEAVASKLPAAAVDLADGVTRIDRSSMQSTIDSLQVRLADAPRDYVSWATLGLAYVQQARITVNAEFYGQAERALDQSFDINTDDNFLAYAGRSALAAARHDFPAARRFAQDGLTINPYSSLLLGALSDAEIQLGEYAAGFDSVQRMLDLSPDTASLSRASYTWELRGEADRATSLMTRALDDAPTPADRTFALHHLASLAFDRGDPNRALELELKALAISPDDPAARFGRAVAEAALGQTATAIDHLAPLVLSVPDPSYLVFYGTLLDSVGRSTDADNQYAVVDATRRLFAANGVIPDADLVLFETRNGNIERALADAERAMTTRPFLTMHDAYAWALHAAGRDEEALVQEERALALGTPSALFHYHAGMIHLALGDAEASRSELTRALAINPYFDPLDSRIAADQLAALGG